MMLEQVEANQATMRTNIEFVQENMDCFLETMLSMELKERNAKIDVEAQRIANQIGSSSLHILGVPNP